MKWAVHRLSAPVRAGSQSPLGVMLGVVTADTKATAITEAMRLYAAHGLNAKNISVSPAKAEP